MEESPQEKQLSIGMPEIQLPRLRLFTNTRAPKLQFPRLQELTPRTEADSSEHPAARVLPSYYRIGYGTKTSRLNGRAITR